MNNQFYLASVIDHEKCCDREHNHLYALFSDRLLPCNGEEIAAPLLMSSERFSKF